MELVSVSDVFIVIVGLALVFIKFCLLFVAAALIGRHFGIW